MTQEQITQFIRIYNTLCTISTKGEDTVVMGECLRAMQILAQELTMAAQQINEEQGE